ncbi:MAG: immunoglobulin domain-containing protein [Saprospiraceae bacterium]
MLNTPAASGSSSVMQTVAGVDYELVVGREAGGNVYTLALFISGDITLAFNGMDVQFKATNASTTVLSPVVELFVEESVEIVIDAPITIFNTICQGEDFTITISTPSGFPDTYQWLLNGATVVQSGNGAADLSLTNAQPTQSGLYEMEATTDGCPDVLSDPIILTVAPSATVTPVDMAPKQLLVGQTGTFSVTASFIDATSTYTWTLAGMDFTVNTVPATVTVGNTDLQINSIINTGLNASTTNSVISITNISAADETYSADLSFTTTNNSLCVANLATVMSGTTSVFPVEWDAFTAQWDATLPQVNLHWQTATETNNRRFVIERSSDGRSFAPIGEIAGAGTVQQTQAYRWVDKNAPAAATLYYRILQEDFDGSQSYSEVRSLRSQGENGWTLHPIRLIDKVVTPQISGLSAGTPVFYRIIDARGALMLQGTTTATGSLHNWSFDAPAVGGMYFLQVVAKDTQQSLPFQVY